MDNTAVTARVDFLRQTALDFPPETARHAERVDGRLGSPRCILQLCPSAYSHRIGRKSRKPELFKPDFKIYFEVR